MTIEPDIVKTLREEEKLGKLESKTYNSNQEMEIYDSIDESIENDYSFKTDNDISNFNDLDNITSESDYKLFSDLLEIINFTEKISTSLHGDFTFEEIIDIVINEFKKSEKYTGSILLLSDDGKKLEIAGTSSEIKKFKSSEKITGFKLKTYKISLEKSKIYSQVIKEGKTVNFKIIDLLEEVVPKKLAFTVYKFINFDKNVHVATPLILDGKIIGAFAMSSTILHNYFISSVKNLALHISHSFDRANHVFEQKKTQEILSKSEQMHRAMIENSPLGIFTVDINGVVSSCNEAFIKMAGYSKDELIGKNVINFPTLRKRDIPKYMKMFKSIISGEVPRPFRFNWVNKSGALCTGELFVSLIKINNKINGIQAIINDITEPQETKVKLKDTEERYNSLFESSMDLVYISDFKGNFIDANKAALEKLGYQYEDIKSLKFSSLLDNKQLIKAINVIREIKKHGYQKSIQEFKLRCKNGEYIYVESLSSLIFHDEKPYAIQGIARDITERKLVELKIKKRTEDLELINLVNKAINTNQSLEEIFLLISKETGKIFNSYDATIYLLSEDKQFLFMKQPGLDDKNKNIIKKLTGVDFSNFNIPLKKDNNYLKVIRNRKPILINNEKEIIDMARFSTDNNFLRKFAPLIIKKLNIKSTMLIPLITEEEDIGLIDISRETYFTDSDLTRFEYIAKQLIIAIEKIILKESKKQSEEKYRDLYERLRDASASCDMNGKFTEYNSIFLKMLGYTSDEISKLSYKDITPKKWHDMEEKIVKEQILKQGFSELYEKEYITKNGNIIPVELTTYLIEDKSKNPTGMWAIIRDISERKKSEKKLMDSKEYFQTLFNKIIDPIAIVDNKGKILEISDKVVDITGFNRDELVGKNFLFTKFANKKTKAILAEKLIKRMAGEKIPPYEIEILKKGGGIIPVEINAETIDYFGKKADMVVFRDVSERKQTDQQLRESEENYRNIVELAPDGMITVNTKGVVNSCNPAFSYLTGYSKEEILGKHVSELPTMDKREIPKYLKLFGSLLRGNKQKSFEFEWTHKNGTLHLAEARASLLKKNNKIIGMQAILRDVTDQKKAEKELKDTHEKLKSMNQELEKKVEERTTEINKLLKQKDEFINQLGHDLKNPLTPITNLLPLIKDRVSDNQTQDQLNIVIRNVDFMKNLVIKTIELAKLSSPNTEFILEDTNLSEEVDVAVEKNKTILEDYNIEIFKNFDEEFIINADKLRLGELFDNIITNAIKYSPNGGSLTFDAKDSGDFVTISIKDNGIGLNEQQKNHIFDEFYKVDKSRHDFDSSGLGLTICKRIVERHGGCIWAESPGHLKGTTIYFTLPKTVNK
jgi:PAS domain S-box-containing protein